MQTSTGNICDSSRGYSAFCQKGFCIDTFLIPSFCEGSAISIMISAINDLGSGPNSKPFSVQGTLIIIMKPRKHNSFVAVYIVRTCLSLF